jgi:hypothetical protein
MRLTIFIALFFGFSVHAEMGKIIGQLGIAEGEVTIDDRPAKKHSILREGATVEVKTGKATLLLGTGTVFHLASNSKMVLSQFNIEQDSKKEKGELDLRFGRTRALIQNKGSESKDVRIRARGATMGVRGTEIFIDVPKDINKPAQFFTLEGLAKIDQVKGPSVEVKQNQGYDGSQSGNSGEMKLEPSKKNISDVSRGAKQEGLHASEIRTPTEVKKMNGEFIRQPTMNVPFPRFDPIQDTHALLKINTTYCNPLGTNPCQ